MAIVPENALRYWLLIISTSCSLGHDKGLNINLIQAILLISYHAMQKTHGKS